MPQADFLAAALPLLEAGVVEAVEWSVDMGWGLNGLPDWLAGLLAHFSAAGALYGHGVCYSPLHARHTPAQRDWLERARVECESRRYQHFSEHFGLNPPPYGAPMPQPALPALIAVAQDRMRRLALATGRPVGLENLALALSAEDARRHGALLDVILSPVDGFILLDLHNLWCNAVNFGIDPLELLECYPAERVRELHLSGGSWAAPLGRRWRRDTHDDAIPQPVLDLLPSALNRLPMVEVVVVERMGGTLKTKLEQDVFVRQFHEVRARVGSGMPLPLSPWRGSVPPEPVEDLTLAEAQEGWLASLVGEAGDPGLLAEWLASADPAALETAESVSRKWYS
ncbi:MAG: hypothetical protein ACI8RZ_005179 [Myxococcota bacterium]|jgi:uncharacterized protein (UPF0276 family)